MELCVSEQVTISFSSLLIVPYIHKTDHEIVIETDSVHVKVKFE